MILQRIETYLLSAGLLLPVYLLVRTPLGEVNLFWVLVLSGMCVPWGVFYLIGKFIYQRFSAPLKKTWFVSVLSGFVVSHAFYIDILFISHPSTGGLALIAIPVYLILASIPVISLIITLHLFAKKRSSIDIKSDPAQ